MDEVDNCGLKSRKAEIILTARYAGLGEGICLRVAQFCGGINEFSAGIFIAQCAGDFIEAFACGIIARSAYDVVVG